MIADNLRGVTLGRSGVLGLVAGAAWGLNYLAGAGTPETLFFCGVTVGLTALGGAFVASLLCRLSGLALGRFDEEIQAKYAKFDYLTLAPCLVLILGATGVQLLPLPAILAAILLAKAAVLLAVLPAPERHRFLTSVQWLSLLFFVSGFAALIYQVVWQRTLFTALGVNMESITLIVSLFMLGLGLGSLLGGHVSERYPDHAPQLFLACELGIAAFGVASLPLMNRVTEAVLQSSLWVICLTVWGLLMVPTMLMGATLPILVGHVNRHYSNVGRSVGNLYAINTLGSALACAATTNLLFPLLGQRGTVLAAASCNALAGFLVWRYIRTNTGPAGPAASPAGAARRAGSLANTRFVVFFAAASGFISLTHELIWMRLVGYMTGGAPGVFAHVLTFFLIGIALGAYWSRTVCTPDILETREKLVRQIGQLLLRSAVLFPVSVAAVSYLHPLWPGAARVATCLSVAALSCLSGCLFPLLCHLGIGSDGDAGRGVSIVYLANIAGSTLGPLVTGFILMDYLSTASLVLLVALLTGIAGMVALSGERARRSRALRHGCLLMLGVVALHHFTSPGLLERMPAQGAGAPHKYRLENRSGIISVIADDSTDLIFGGGMYDGTFNVDPVVNSNGIDRCYMIAALHRNPKEILEIGLSSASWTAVMAGYGPVSSLTVVEINPGYEAIVRHYPEQRRVLSMSRVSIKIDDGRRWLNRNPGARFDLIVQNTTWHWRSQTTNLLSREYLMLCKEHLKPGGVMYWNTTHSNDVVETATRTFRHVVAYSSFIAASDEPFRLKPAQIRDNLKKFRDSSGVVFRDDVPERRAALERLSRTELKDLVGSWHPDQACRVITDDNMATEFPRPPVYSPDASWNRLWNRIGSR